MVEGLVRNIIYPFTKSLKTNKECTTTSRLPYREKWSSGTQVQGG